MRLPPTTPPMEFAFEAPTCFGSGPFPVLAFHGFSQSPEAFADLAEAAPQLCIYSFPLYAHTSTPPRAYRLTDWQTQMHAWIKAQAWPAFSVIGFSLGCRPALQVLTLPNLPITKAVLLAPEALSPHWVYRFATGTRLGRGLLQAVLGSWALPALGQWLSRNGLLPPYAGPFLQKQLGTEARRWRIAASWRHYRRWSVSPKDIAAQAPHVTVCLGQAPKDAFAPAKGARQLAQLHAKAHLRSFPCSHFHLLSHYIAHYATLGPEWQLWQTQDAKM